MTMAEGRTCDLGASKTYAHAPNQEWRHTRLYGGDCKENFADKDTHDMEVRLDGGPSNMLASHGGWSEDCAEVEGDTEAVLSYSGGSVKDCGTVGSGA